MSGFHFFSRDRIFKDYLELHDTPRDITVKKLFFSEILKKL